MWQERSIITSTSCGTSVATLGLFVSLNMNLKDLLIFLLAAVHHQETQGLTGEEEFWPQVD